MSIAEQFLDSRKFVVLKVRNEDAPLLRELIGEGLKAYCASKGHPDADAYEFETLQEVLKRGTALQNDLKEQLEAKARMYHGSLNGNGGYGD